jgi:hypothetical protein
MRRIAAIIASCFLITLPGSAQETFNPDGIPLSAMGGLIIIRQGNQTIMSLGGGIFPRRVKVVTATPEGPVVTRFSLPSSWVSPTSPLAVLAPANLRVEIPDPDGVLYIEIEGELIRSKGISRQLQSPSIPVGTHFPLQVRAAFKVGDNLLIEDKQILLHAGESTTVIFDGRTALSVPLQVEEAKVIPFPPREIK